MRISCTFKTGNISRNERSRQKTLKIVELKSIKCVLGLIRPNVFLWLNYRLPDLQWFYFSKVLQQCGIMTAQIYRIKSYALWHYIICMRVRYHYSASVGERSIASVCLYVFVSACPRAYLWNRWTDLHESFCAHFVAVARSSSGGVAIRCVLPVYGWRHIWP